MQSEQATSIFVSLIPLMIMSVLMAIGSFFLAREKGRSRLKWTILACIPFVNFCTIWMLVGMTNLHTERKLDRVLALLERSPANH